MPNEKLEKLKHDQYVAERKLTAATHKKVLISRLYYAERESSYIQSKTLVTWLMSFSNKCT